MAKKYLGTFEFYNNDSTELIKQVTETNTLTELDRLIDTMMDDVIKSFEIINQETGEVLRYEYYNVKFTFDYVVDFNLDAWVSAKFAEFNSEEEVKQFIEDTFSSGEELNSMSFKDYEINNFEIKDKKINFYSKLIDEYKDEDYDKILDIEYEEE